MTTQASTKQFSIQYFVAELRKFPQSAFDHTDQIIHFLEKTQIAPDTLTQYLTWDRQHYTRNLIDKTPLYEEVEEMYAPTKERFREQNYRADLETQRLKGCR